MNTPDPINVAAKLDAYRRKVDAVLADYLPPSDTRPAWLHQAMGYSVSAGGKRLRPILLIAASELCPSPHDPMPAAAAVEFLHTYSLIHDDLPCMDDSDLRRGLPTCHKKFDEATALLAGDALLTYALWMLSDRYRSVPTLAVELIHDLGHAAGSQKLIGGQMEDLLGEQEKPTPDRLEFIHENKTSALITACLTMGARLANAPADVVSIMTQAGRHLGLAFQIIDDILDVTSSAEAMGKPVGADAENAKMTYPLLFGLEKSRQKAHEHSEEARRLCRCAGGDTRFLVGLIDQMERRVN